MVHHVTCYNGFKYFWGDSFFNFTSNTEVVEFLRNMTEQRNWFDERQASWNTILDPPFAETITARGIGFTFNIIDSEDLLNLSVLSEDLVYTRNTMKVKKPYPWKATADETSGLVITIKRNRFLQGSLDNCINNNFIVHSPYQLPIETNRFNFEYGRSLDVLLSVDVVQVDEDFKRLSVDNRQCYLKDERKLLFYKIYTKSNCERECLTFVTFGDCSCVPFFFVRNKTMTVCDVPGSECAWKLYNLDYDQYQGLFKTEGICNCLPPCETVKYSFEAVATKYIGNFSQG